MIYRFLILFSLFLLVACGTPEATSVPEVAEAEPTNTAVSTDTPEPTATATELPTDTPEPTNTVVPTNTPEPTETPTEVPTDTPEPTATAVPTDTPEPLPTNTAVPVATNPPPPPAALPASGSPPTGPNLVVNPGFEYGSDPWNVGLYGDAKLYNDDHSSIFVHSGSFSAQYYVTQRITNVQAGTNYRAGAWVKIWSSNGEDRNISDNPAGSGVKICINANGDLNADTIPTTCSPRYQPLDSWQYITIDAVAISDQIRVIVSGGAPENNKAIHTEVYIDDVEVGISPVSVVATATPVPVSYPYPPAPVAFDAITLRDNMNNSRSAIEQMGGLLDRLLNGSRETCDEYDGYYRSLVASPRFDGVPTEWQAIYNDYIYAVDNGISSNQAIFDTCFNNSGTISALNYGVAREGINNSLNRLIPAIEAANSMLGQ